jgi:hypothetical protein
MEPSCFRRAAARRKPHDRRATMIARVKTRTKYWLTKLGQHTSDKVVHHLDAVANYLTVGRWFKQHDIDIPIRVDSRYKLFDLVAPQLENAKVLYMEFGVWKGDSMRYWSNLLKNEHAILHGFDSFEGLPEDWNSLAMKGYFSMDGAMPVIDDHRVTFFKGWFEETLPRYRVPHHDRLFINLDADLYSSTKTVLGGLKHHIKDGTFIYFDEFSDRFHEMKAFDEFLREGEMKFRVVGADAQLSSVIFQRVK